MAKRSKALPLILLLVFILGLVGIYLSTINPPPSLEDAKLYNLGTDREIYLRDLISKKDFSIIVFIKAGDTPLEKVTKTMSKLKESGLTYRFNIIFIGIDGDFKTYKDFLYNNPKIFIPFVWLYTNNTNYFDYMEDPKSPNIYIASMSKGFRLKYLGSKIGVSELISEINKFMAKV